MAILPVLACFAFLPGAQAVEPAAPDPALPNSTRRMVQIALLEPNGAGNTIRHLVGRRSLANADASFNTGVGAGALLFNNGDSNTAVGAAALLLNTTGTLNTAVGTVRLFSTTDGSDNNAVGAFALFDQCTGSSTTPLGGTRLQPIRRQRK